MEEHEIDYTVAFWNCHKMDCDPLFLSKVSKLLIENKISIFALSESITDPNDIVDIVSSDVKHFRHLKSTSPKRIEVFTTLPKEIISIKGKGKRYVVVNLPNANVDIVFIHLLSKFGTNELTQVIENEKILNEIYSQYSGEKKIFIGDFNSNPYDSDLTSSRVFNSIFPHEINHKIGRREFSKNRKHINPCWKLYNSNNITGTFRFSSSKYDNIGWSMLDQVVFTKETEELFNYDSLEILTEVSGFDFLKNDGSISEECSDHLPIKFSLNNLK